MKLSGEDLSRYSNKIESVGLRKCRDYHLACLTEKVMSQQQTFSRPAKTRYEESATLSRHVGL